MSDPVAGQAATPGWIVYMLECADRTLYTGITTDLARRLAHHGRRIGAKYTHGRGPFFLRYAEQVPTRGAALKREAAIKALRRADKLALIARQGSAELPEPPSAAVYRSASSSSSSASVRATPRKRQTPPQGTPRRLPS